MASVGVKAMALQMPDGNKVVALERIFNLIEFLNIPGNNPLSEYHTVEVCPLGVTITIFGKTQGDGNVFYARKIVGWLEITQAKFPILTDVAKRVYSDMIAGPKEARPA